MGHRRISGISCWMNIEHLPLINIQESYVVVVCHLTIVAIGYGLFLALGNKLRTTQLIHRLNGIRPPLSLFRRFQD